MDLHTIKWNGRSAQPGKRKAERAFFAVMRPPGQFTELHVSEMDFDTISRPSNRYFPTFQLFFKNVLVASMLSFSTFPLSSQ
jgi:hypothetical protein